MNWWRVVYKRREGMLKPGCDLPVYAIADEPSSKLRDSVYSLLPLFAEASLKVGVIRYAESDSPGELAQLKPEALADLVTSDCLDRKELQQLQGCVTAYSFDGEEARLMVKAQELLRTNDLLFIVGCSGRQGCWRLTLEPCSSQQKLPDCCHSLTLPVLPLQSAFETIWNHASQLQKKRPVWACVLIGGKSSRMGQPKHLIKDRAGITWLERLVALIQPHVEGIVLSGSGEVPDSLGSLVRIPDIPGVQGPLTGILSVMRWQPDVSWLLLACDMPHISGDAIRWLLDSTTLGTWAVLPTVTAGRTAEPLFARYEPQSKAYFEELCARGERRIGRVADFNKTRLLPVPEKLQVAWSNINTPQELRSVRL